MKKLLFVAILAFTTGCVPSAYQSSTENKSLIFNNIIYESSIRTVLFYPFSNEINPYLKPASVSLNSSQSLILEFDDLKEAPDTYYVKLFHCTRDWKKSSLSDLEFLSEYNEFNITDYQYSVDTKVDYIHYRFEVPQVKLPGNYLLIVYRNNPDDLILSRRFLVFDPRIEINLAGDINVINPVLMSDHVVKFNLNYRSFRVDDPIGNISVDIIQNHNWQSMVTGLTPTFVKEDLKELEFRYFNLENAIKGTNEFRFFDLRSVIHFGQNVETVINDGLNFTAIIEKEKPRTGLAYGHLRDLNGKYTLENYDRRSALTGSEYVNVLFTLETEKIDGQVFITGELTNWGQTSPVMTYNDDINAYTANLLLKQGWYNYQYGIRSDALPEYYLEGSHAQSENEYEILVYYRDLMKRADLLVGYTRFYINAR